MPSPDYKRCVICSELYKTRRKARKTCGLPACKQTHNANLAKTDHARVRSREYFATWYDRNRAKVIARVTKNKARKAASPSPLTPSGNT